MSDTRPQKRPGLLSPENWVITGAILLLLLFAGKRMKYTVYLRNHARVEKELKRIHQMQHQYYLEHTRFGSATDIGFQTKFPDPTTRYSINMDSLGFTAYVTEVTGSDPFGDDQAGNQYIAINASGMIFRGSQTPH